MDMVRERGADPILDALNRSHVYVSDGRRFVQRNRGARYDLIQVGVFGAWCSGCGNAFTEDFFRILSQRITPNGGVTFNAYPPAVQAGLRAFRSLAIFSPGTSRISDTWGTNQAAPPELETDKFRGVMRRLEAESGPGTVRIKRSNIAAGCVIPAADIAPLVTGITAATDDKPTTEYFLTNNQFMYRLNWRQVKPERDMRVFECEGRTPNPLRRVIEERAAAAQTTEP